MRVKKKKEREREREREYLKKIVECSVKTIMRSCKFNDTRYIISFINTKE
jgi:hypothetical protein